MIENKKTILSFVCFVILVFILNSMVANNGDRRNCGKKHPMINRFARTVIEGFGFAFVAEFCIDLPEITSITQLKNIFGLPSLKNYSFTRAVKRSPYYIIGVVLLKIGLITIDPLLEKFV